MIKARLFFKDDPARKFEIRPGETCLGRSQDCDIVIPDPYVSRRQVIITLSATGAVLKNIGSNPIKAAGRAIPSGQAAAFNDNDEIEIGRTSLIFAMKLPESRPQTAPPLVEDEKTVIFSSPVQPHGPRLLISDPSGQGRTFVLDHTPVTIGRASDADVSLDDRAVSRHHAIIERRSGGFYIRAISNVNPVILNNEKIRGKRLYSGDQIRIGTFLLSFVSDEKKDRRPVRQTGGQGKFSSFIPWISAILLLVVVFTSYLFYTYIYESWMVRRHIKEAVEYIDRGDSARADRLLKNMLSGNIAPEYARQARKLLVKSILTQAERLSARDDFQAEEKLLVGFLKRHGAGPGAGPVWEKLDHCRLREAGRLKAAGGYLAAMKKYSLIEKDSPYYDQAQREIGRIWLQYQKEKLKKQTIYQLVQEAEEAFREKRYLTPVNHNAYAAYQAILSMDQSNQLARKRIEEIRAIFKKRGEDAMAQKDYQEALSSFERYLLITPDDKEVKALLTQCREHLSSGTNEEAADRQKERVKRLLKQSGAKSSWIMKYLFEDKKQEADTPW